MRVVNRQYCNALFGLFVVLYSANASAYDIAFLAPVNGYWQVWVIDADGNNEKQITHTPFDKNSLSWYPDNQRLLANGTQGQLVTVSINNRQEKLHSISNKVFTDAVLSPNGQQILFSEIVPSSAQSKPRLDMWLMDTDGSHLQQLTNTPGMEHEPRWSPQGDSFYFLTGEGKQSHDIWKMDIASKSIQQITVAQLYNFDVAISYDEQLAYSSNRSGNYDIWVQSGQRSAQQLTKNAGLDASPSWSPDAKTIVFESARDNRIGLWLINIDTRKVKPLLHSVSTARKPLWKH